MISIIYVNITRPQAPPGTQLTQEELEQILQIWNSMQRQIVSIISFRDVILISFSNVKMILFHSDQAFVMSVV